VAIGTVADMVPMIGENRALVRQGLYYIRSNTRQGLFSLMGVSRIEPKSVSSSTIGFSIGPRINAAGRIASAQDALDLLLSNDVFKTGQLAQTLDNHNRERQNITRTIQEEAETQALAETEESFLLFAADPSFNPGVVGLAASRLVDTYYRPAIVGHQGEEVTRASCRSIAEFHITEALEECADLLTHFGGHAAAAGFTVKNENLPELLKRLRDQAKTQLDGLDLRPLLQADAEVKLIDLKPDLLKEMDLLQPTGYGNPEAVFVSKNVMVKSKRTVGAEGAHLKMSVSDGKIYFDVIAFRLGHLLPVLTDRIDIIFTFEINEFQGRRSYQLNVIDIKIKEF
ncbi:MAG: single-stranded-DNA-specific exonuclease RecJ, partial [Chloroflexi bacterium]|nr:single-stranded-DNA-specific exonuclease RecJ [Chloroflexota bacterium]